MSDDNVDILGESEENDILGKKKKSLAPVVDENTDFASLK